MRSRLGAALAGMLLAALAGAAEPLTIAAASDLIHSLPELNRRFVAAHPETRIEAVFGSSGNLSAQIRNGAPFHVFLAADGSDPEAVVKAGQGIPDTVTVYARGRLALWSTNPAIAVEQGMAATVATARRIAIANPEHAPYGRAARAALEFYGLWPAVQSKRVTADSVAQAAQFVLSGNADAGLVAWSLLRGPALAGVGRYQLVPENAHPALEQTAVLTRHGASHPAARAYLQFLGSVQAQEILVRHGLGGG